MGYAVVPEGSLSLSEAIDRADRAMYRDKERRKKAAGGNESPGSP